jgi:hypothetical protein
MNKICPVCGKLITKHDLTSFVEGVRHHTSCIPTQSSVVIKKKKQCNGKPSDDELRYEYSELTMRLVEEGSNKFWEEKVRDIEQEWQNRHQCEILPLSWTACGWIDETGRIIPTPKDGVYL